MRVNGIPVYSTLKPKADGGVSTLYIFSIFFGESGSLEEDGSSSLLSVFKTN